MNGFLFCPLALLFLMVPLQGGGGPLQAVEAAAQPRAALFEKLEAFIAYEMEDKALPALSMALVDGQEIIWSKGFGMADPDAKRPATGETVYRVASVSKLFTAMAVLQLVERGMLDLDAPVTDYLPDFRPENPFGRSITLRQLLSHRSGLVREPPVGSYFDPAAPSLRATVESLNHTRLVYAPEARMKYSNAAVSVAGRVVEQVVGAPFEAYVQRALLDRMGLSRSSFLPRADLRRDLARGYMWTYDGRTFEAPVFELGIGPAANLYTTVNDLGRFMAVLFAGGRGPGGAVLRPETLARMWQVQYAPPDEQSGFGLGFFISPFQGERRVQHSGVMYGYATRLAALPDRKLGVVVVGTVDAANVVVDRIAEYALALLLAHQDGRPLPGFATTEPVRTALARRLEGRYAGPDTLDLVARDGALFLYKGAERLRLKRQGDTLVVDDRLAYGYRLLPQGRTLRSGDDVFRRIDRPRPAPPAPHHAGLIGEYGWDHNTLYILERDGRLYALIEWFFYYPLTERSEDVYAFPDYGLYDGEELVFARAPGGRATRVTAGGVVFERRRIAPEEGRAFRIEPVRPVSALRAEALGASPPVEAGSFRAPELVDLAALDPALKLDIRYATPDNFMGTAFYASPRAFLQRPAAEALLGVQADLRRDSLGLIVYDAYRPWHVTRMFWEATPDSLKPFVADPAGGSRHNRGCAVDVGLYDLQTNAPVPMPSQYDEFTPRAHADYPGGTAQARWYRERLRGAMEKHGFSVYVSEWWHFDYRDWRQYPILNTLFEDL